MPKHRRFERIQLWPQVRVTNNDLALAQQLLLAIGHEQPWLLALVEVAHVSPVHVPQ
jgi:hypothetical protein